MKQFWDVIERMPNSELWDKDNFKANYLIYDVETTGFDPPINRINQFGWLLVRDGKCSEDQHQSRHIKTPYHPRTYSAVYAQRGEKRMQFLTMVRKAGCDLDEVKKAIDENDGSVYGLDCVPQHIQEFKDYRDRPYFTCPVDVTGIRSDTTLEKGLDREQALTIITRSLEMACNKRLPIVGHNLYKFDIPFVEHEAREFCNISLEVDRDLIIDTGMIIKASQSRTSLNRKESLADFYNRASDKRSKAKWTLDTYCHEAFGLAKYGLNPELQHKDAGYDCYVNHCLVLELIKT